MTTPEEVLALAERLAWGATEAERRAAVSRAYYALFHVARALMLSCGFRVPRSERAHAYLWLRLCHAGEATVELAGNELNNLRRERGVADYEWDRYMPDPVNIVETARRAIARLQAAEREPRRSLVVAAMRASERDVLREETWKP